VAPTYRSVCLHPGGRHGHGPFRFGRDSERRTPLTTMRDQPSSKVTRTLPPNRCGYGTRNPCHPLPRITGLSARRPSIVRTIYRKTRPGRLIDSRVCRSRHYRALTRVTSRIWTYSCACWCGRDRLAYVLWPPGWGTGQRTHRSTWCRRCCAAACSYPGRHDRREPARVTSGAFIAAGLPVPEHRAQRNVCQLTGRRGLPWTPGLDGHIRRPAANCSAAES